MNSSKYDCADVRQNLHLLLGGELDSDPKLRVELKATEEHLLTCGACRQELEAAKHSRELYLQAAIDADSEELDLWPGIRSRLYSEQILRPRSGSDREASAVALAPKGATRKPQLTLLRRLLPLSTAVAAAAVFLIALPTLKRSFIGETAPTSIENAVASPVTSQSESANSSQVASSTVVAPADLVAETTPAVTAESRVPNSSGGLRAVFSGDESLTEREQRELLEQGLYPNQRLPYGSGPGAFPTHSFEPSLYDVVNQRRLR